MPPLIAAILALNTNVYNVCEGYMDRQWLINFNDLSSPEYNLVIDVASEFGLDKRLLLAIIKVESGGNPYAIRYERNYKWILNPAKYAEINGTTLKTEEEAQRISWGLGQVIGGTARSIGYTGPLPMLCQPKHGLYYAAKYLRQQWVRYEGHLEKTIAAYNSGSAILVNGEYLNQAYVDKISKAMSEIF